MPMNNDNESNNVEQLLDRIESSIKSSERVPIKAILEKVGRRSFGALLLLAGLITLAPVVGDIPGVPTIIGLFVMLTAIQLLLGRHHFWLPQWLLERSIAKDKLCKALGWMRRPSRFVDRLLQPRLTILVQEIGIAIICLFIAILMPVMELVPFSANGAGAALTALSLSLTARDGLFALLAYISMILTLGIILFVLI